MTRLTSAAVLMAAIAALSGCAASASKPEPMAPAQPVAGFDAAKFAARSGRITFAGQPTEAALKQFAAEGGAVVIDMRTHKGTDTPPFDEAAQVRALGMSYEALPMSPATFSRADVDAFAKTLNSTKGPVLVHCATSNRVGALWAAYLAIDQGVPVDEAIAAGKAAGLASPEAEAAARRVIAK